MITLTEKAKHNRLLYALVQEAKRNSLTEFLDEWELNKSDFDGFLKEIEDKLGLNIAGI